MPEAERLEKEWRHVAPVKIGGPATGQQGEQFTPGLYLEKGYVITSRGCPNRCWFCGVWQREGHPLRAYVLCGYPGDTFDRAIDRFEDCINAGFLPMAMLHRDETGERDPEWVKFAWPWIRPATMFSKYKQAV
jgi:radical SAM superfamily enzyme YgiQ (UPF0313 family)